MNILERYDERIRAANSRSSIAWPTEELASLVAERAALSHLLDVAHALLPTNPANDWQFASLRTALAAVSA